ncbi:MAG: NrtA/SsuA/CpmA family ABC transporter substrate-binding protein [Deltaproteobacteria bacterium]|jgi:sulfonate transport system substrate-binding protein|nr:NrtA/SsuA/CpmA family ABC transporter substrate-binding protein [Deltaproteobacteria bacterium]
MKKASPTIASPAWVLILVAAVSAALAVLLDPLPVVQAEDTVVRLTYSMAPNAFTTVAKERGELAKELAAKGIKVEWVGPFPNHAPTIQAVVGETADFSFGGTTTVGFAAILAGSPLVFTQYYDYSPRTSAILAIDPAIKTVKDLVGKSVANNRSGIGETLLTAALEANGLDRSQVEYVYMNPPEGAMALASGAVDAWVMWSPEVDLARETNKAHDVFSERDLPYPLDYSGWVARREYVEKNPEIVKAVNEAFRHVGEWISTHPEEHEKLLKSVWKYDDSLTPYFISIANKYTFHDPSDKEFLDRFQASVDWLTKNKVLPGSIDVRAVLLQP